MKTFLNAVMKKFGYVPAQKMKVQTKKDEPLTALAVNEQVRSTLTMARDFYTKRGNRIVSVDLNNYLGAFEEILLMSATDGSSVETAKLFGQVPYVLHGRLCKELPSEKR